MSNVDTSALAGTAYNGINDRCARASVSQSSGGSAYSKSVKVVSEQEAKTGAPDLDLEGWSSGDVTEHLMGVKAEHSKLRFDEGRQEKQIMERKTIILELGDSLFDARKSYEHVVKDRHQQLTKKDSVLSFGQREGMVENSDEYSHIMDQGLKLRFNFAESCKDMECLYWLVTEHSKFLSKEFQEALCMTAVYTEEQVEPALAEVRKYQEQLKQENATLQKEQSLLESYQVRQEVLSREVSYILDYILEGKLENTRDAE